MSHREPPYRHPAPRPEWLAAYSEEPLEPRQRIVDAHHHLWDMPGNRYLLDEFLSDLDCGHRVEATFFVQCHFAHLPSGPEHLRPSGETRMVAGLIHESTERTGTRIGAGVVAFADLRYGEERLNELFALHRQHLGARFVGIRQPAARDPNFPSGVASAPPPDGLLRSAPFRRGFALLSRHGLVFDSWGYSVQLPDVVDLADGFPETTIVLDHCGGILGVGPYQGSRDVEFATWKARLIEVAKRPNIIIKLGGLGMVTSGFGFEKQNIPPSSIDLAAAWRPYFETCIDAFGSGRCIFESNFPVDKASTGYGVLWNAFKRIAAGASQHEKDSLFFANACRIYRVPLD